MKMRDLTLSFCVLLFLSVCVFGRGGEFIGQFDPSLVPNTDDSERVVFRGDSGERVKAAGTFKPDAHFAIGRLLDPQTGQYSVLAFLVEEKGSEPSIYVDSNDDHQISADEKYVFQRNADDTYVWHTTAVLRIKEGFFKSCPVFIRYLKSYKIDKMTTEDRLMTQSTEVLARGKVNVNGKDILVQYAYDLHERKIDPQSGWLGADVDGDGAIDMDALSPEAAKANKESVVFRVGSFYFSTKKADIKGNQIVLRENEAKDYKRSELYIDKEFPDFGFTDFDGKKHRFSEFKGKYILLDVWGWWCGPCRRELPYIREAASRFKSRNLQVIGLNTDPDYTIESMRKTFADNQMTWTHAQFSSVSDFLNSNLRVEAFPTTFLIAPDGKILSMGRADRDEPDLRGADLLTTLDKILPKQ